MKKTFMLCLLIALMGNIQAQQVRFAQEANTIRLMSYNIRNGMGMDRITDLKRTAAVIESVDPEIVSLQEIDSVTNRSQQVDILGQLAILTRMHHVYAPAIDYDGGKYGLGILSKNKPISSQSVALPGREEERTVLIVEFDKYVFCATHWSLTAEDRLASIEIINNISQQFDKPVFLAGDLNAEPQSDEIKKLYQDWKPLNNTELATWPADEPRDHIDYILGYKSKGQKFTTIQTTVVNEPNASDHRPLFADVRMPIANDKVMRTTPYLQNPSTDGMTIMWATNVPCRSWVEFGTNSIDMKPVRSYSEGMMIANNTINKIRLNDLRPNTTYYYRAVSQEMTKYRAYSKEFGDTVKSPVHSFRTWDNDATDFTAVIFNDLHQFLGTFDKLVEQVKDIDYDFVIYNGDVLDDIDFESQAIAGIAHYSKGMKAESKPAIYIRGNHEIRGAYSPYLWNLLEKKGGATTYGAFNVGDTRFIMLDCGEDKPDDHWVYYGMNDFTQYRIDQAEFLKKELASKEFKKAKKRVLIHHVPLFGEHQDEFRACKEMWEPILAQAPIDIAINGHTHQFEYIKKGQDKNTYPVVIGGAYGEENATVMILRKEGKKMTLDVLNAQGENVLKLDL